MRKAFTLVEFLITISILGLLMGLLFPAIQIARETARDAVCKANLHDIYVKIETISGNQYLQLVDVQATSYNCPTMLVTHSANNIVDSYRQIRYGEKRSNIESDAIIVCETNLWHNQQCNVLHMNGSVDSHSHVIKEY